MQLLRVVNSTDKASRVSSSLFCGRERPVTYSLDFLNSSDESLSDTIQVRGIEVLKNLQNEAISFGATEFVAVGTEVFRKAKNGSSFLHRIQNEFGMSSVSILDQHNEAVLGQMTLAAFIGREDALKYVMWDSGAASFQLTYGDEPPYMEEYGTAVVTKKLLREVKKSSSASPNPVSKLEADALMQSLQRELKAPPSWMTTAIADRKIIAIGGDNSMFALAKTITIYKRSGELPTQDSEAVDSVEPFDITVEDVLAAIHVCVDKEDDELRPFVAHVHSDGVANVLSKLSLLCTVMRHCGISRVTFMKTFGLCAGLLTSDEYWPMTSTTSTMSDHSIT